MKISVDKIIISKDNPRQSFDEEGLRRLGESIKTHGLLQPIIVRRKGSLYELVVGERRLRASVLVGFNEIEATMREIDDATVMELRLIENCHREDLTDAEKGDAILSLWANYEKYKTIKDVAQSISKPYATVLSWTDQSRRLSDKVKESVASQTLTNEHARRLMKYPHSIQDKLADVIIRRKISSHKEVLRRFTELYDLNPNADLDMLANRVLGIETVVIPKTELTEEQKQKLEEKKQLVKVHRIGKKPSKPLTKDEVKKKLAKKTDFKFEKVKVSIGNKGSAPPLKREIKPLAIPIPETPDYSLCKCAFCPLFAKHCKGRCWT